MTYAHRSVSIFYFVTKFNRNLHLRQAVSVSFWLESKTCLRSEAWHRKSRNSISM